METKPDLRPCPFCGGDEIYVVPVAASRGRAAMCQKCLAEGPYERTKEKAGEAWNRRAEPENRVLTLEEAKTYCEGGADATPLWYEEKYHNVNRWMIIDLPELAFGSTATVKRLVNSQFFEATYGEKWRCWLRKPTAEEMANTIWEE